MFILPLTFHILQLFLNVHSVVSSYSTSDQHHCSVVLSFQRVTLHLLLRFLFLFVFVWGFNTLFQHHLPLQAVFNPLCCNYQTDLNNFTSEVDKYRNFRSSAKNVCYYRLNRNSLCKSFLFKTFHVDYNVSEVIAAL